MKHLHLILTAVFLNTLGQLFLKAGMIKVGEVNLTWGKLPSLLLTVFRNPFIELGVLCYVVSLLFWLWTLSKVDVGVAYPMLSIGYVLSVFAGYYWFHEPLGAMKIAGVFIIMIGVYLVAHS